MTIHLRLAAHMTILMIPAALLPLLVTMMTPTLLGHMAARGALHQEAIMDMIAALTGRELLISYLLISAYLLISSYLLISPLVSMFPVLFPLYCTPPVGKKMTFNSCLDQKQNLMIPRTRT